jgi:hypothetical protein
MANRAERAIGDIKLIDSSARVRLLQEEYHLTYLVKPFLNIQKHQARGGIKAHHCIKTNHDLHGGVEVLIRKEYAYK